VKILFDHCVPKPLRRELLEHEISTAQELGWEALTNGKLLEQGEANRFEALVTVDQNFRFQQNLIGRSIAVCWLQTALP
jgi:predicted nuclease of predicted toxin-antitoxin system